MTRLYNYFAQVPAQAGFCPVVARLGGEVGTVAAAALPAFAAKAIPELEAPFQAHYARWRDYRVALAAWRAGQATAPATPPPEPAVAVAAASAPAGGDWRIQLGAFSGQAAAETAWERIRAKQPGFARYTPSFEPVPGRDLVRVRVGQAKDRAEAIGLCATAAAAGLDCLPVSP